jgi:hypothetical protein
MFPSKNRAALPFCAALAILTACTQSGGAVPPSASTGAAVRAGQPQSTGMVPDDTTPILNGLNKDVVIGSTVDPNNGDKGPHSLAIVKLNYGLKKGQLVVCNFADSSGTPGNGTTIEVLNPAPSSTPVPFVQSNDIKGCDGTAISSGNQVYATGLSSGLMAWFDQTGKEQSTYGSPLAAPFAVNDVYTQKMYASEYMFASDAQTGSIVSIGTTGYASGFDVQVATGFAVGSPTQTGWNTLGPSGLAYNHKKDTLFIADGVTNTIVEFTHASSLLVKNEIVVLPSGKFKCLHKKTTCGKKVYSGPALEGPVAMAILPNGNMIVANTEGGSSVGNTLVELTPTGQILDTKVVDSGPAPAIFGLAASGSSDSNTVVFYTDTNDNTVHELEP